MSAGSVRPCWRLGNLRGSGSLNELNAHDTLSIWHDRQLVIDMIGSFRVIKSGTWSRGPRPDSARSPCRLAPHAETVILAELPVLAALLSVPAGARRTHKSFCVQRSSEGLWQAVRPVAGARQPFTHRGYIHENRLLRAKALELILWGSKRCSLPSTWWLPKAGAFMYRLPTRSSQRCSAGQVTIRAFTLLRSRRKDKCCLQKISLAKHVESRFLLAGSVLAGTGESRVPVAWSSDPSLPLGILSSKLAGILWDCIGLLVNWGWIDCVATYECLDPRPPGDPCSISLGPQMFLQPEKLVQP